MALPLNVHLLYIIEHVILIRYNDDALPEATACILPDIRREPEYRCCYDDEKYSDNVGDKGPPCVVVVMAIMGRTYPNCS